MNDTPAGIRTFGMKKRKPRSLRKKLIVGLLVSTVVPILLIGAVSYYVIYLILDQKTAKGIQSNLHQVRTNIEKVYSNLNDISQQLAARDMQLLLETEDPAEKYILGQQVFSRLQLLSFTNPDINLVQIVDKSTNDTFYENQPVQPNADMSALPALSQYKGVALHAPHPTFAYDKGLVLSVSRPVNMVKDSGKIVYVETNLGMYDQLLNSRQYGISTVQLLTDASGTVMFSQDPAFPVGSHMSVDTHNRLYELTGSYYYFQDYSKEMGWSVYCIVHKSEFQKELRSWAIAWVAIAALSLVLGLAVGWSIWRMVYRPLLNLSKEIRQLGEEGFENADSARRSIGLTYIVELDMLIHQFQGMRSNIWNLLTELKQKEKDKRHLAVEKLAAQINPHFLYNTLNTIQWLAKVKGNEDIFHLVTVFIRLLRYNLGKDGELVELRDEIHALKDYVALQQIRYNYEFSVRIDADPQALGLRVPRFLLQPLIENALYHGVTKEGSAIELAVGKEEDGRIRIEVRDNGRGMSEESLSKMLSQDVAEQDKVGMGIGLKYVGTMLQTHFGPEARLQAVSSPERGTTMFFLIPREPRQEDYDD